MFCGICMYVGFMPSSNWTVSPATHSGSPLPSLLVGWWLTELLNMWNTLSCIFHLTSNSMLVCNITALATQLIYWWFQTWNGWLDQTLMKLTLDLFLCCVWCQPSLRLLGSQTLRNQLLIFYSMIVVWPGTNKFLMRKPKWFWKELSIPSKRSVVVDMGEWKFTHLWFTYVSGCHLFVLMIGHLLSIPECLWES